MRSTNNNHALYESIMRRVSKVVKQAINEAAEDSVYRMTDADIKAPGTTIELISRSDVDTSQVKNMACMFCYAKSFNQPVNFDTSNVKNMSHMFYGALSFNQPVNFDTSNVKDMAYMFGYAKSFDQPVNFDTSNVKDMAYMFYGALSFNQPVNFDTSNVVSMYCMFKDAESFNQPVNFDTSKVRDMTGMFSGAMSFNQPLDHLDVSSVWCIDGMFYESGMDDRYIIDFVERVAKERPNCSHRRVTDKPALQKKIDSIFNKYSVH